MVTKFKLFENHNSSPFKDEHELKEILLKDKDFAKGDVHQAIINIMYDEWQDHKDWGYDKALNWFGEEYGMLPEFCVFLGSYNGQVGNGGHAQYFGNGYASSESKGGFGDYRDLTKHEEFTYLFKDLGIDKIEFGKEAYEVANNFNLEFDDEYETCYSCDGNGEADCDVCNGQGTVECGSCGGSGEGDSEEEDIYCEECDGDGVLPCDECGGDAVMRCDECDGQGEVISERNVPMISHWDHLDTKWYEVNDSFMNSFNDYLKTLTLDGEKISDLVKLSKDTQGFNL